MDYKETIRQLIDNPEMKVDPEMVWEIQDKYPFFTLPAALLLKRNPEEISSGRRAELLSRLALYATDKTALLELIDIAGDDWAHIYPPVGKPEPVTTSGAIDTFIDTYGSSSPKEEALLEKLIFNPMPDYAQILAEESGTDPVPTSADPDPSSPDALIDAFIAKNRTEVISRPATVPATGNPDKDEDTDEDKNTRPIPSVDDNSLLSESLAKIFIKQHRYERAYEIIRNLSLNYPEKSIYFADQLRFLKKLMINQRYRQAIDQ